MQPAATGTRPAAAAATALLLLCTASVCGSNQRQRPWLQTPHHGLRTSRHLLEEPAGNAAQPAIYHMGNPHTLCTPARLAWLKELRAGLTGKADICLGSAFMNLHDVWPRLAAAPEGAAAIALSDVRLKVSTDEGREPPIITGNFSMCTGQVVCNTKPGEYQRFHPGLTCAPYYIQPKVGMFWAKLDAWGPPGTPPPPLDKQGCTVVYDYPVVFYSRISPPNHIGHRMLTDLPALWGLKLYLEQVVGLPTSELALVLVDTFGGNAWGADNFAPMLMAMGFKSFETNTKRLADVTYCAPHAIVLGTSWWLTSHSDERGNSRNIWERPDVLWDADSTTMVMLEAIREQSGLPAPLPFAPLYPQKVVIASRDPEMRKAAGQIPKRLFLNEATLVEELKKRLQPSNIEVEQLEFSTLTLAETLQKFETTSLLLGYHGATMDLAFWLPRGAYLLEILPKGTAHAPLYPVKAHLTGKQFINWVSNDWQSQICDGMKGCENATEHKHYHDAHMELLPHQIGDLVDIVDLALKMQRLTLRRMPSHWRKQKWEDMTEAKDELEASKLRPFRHRQPRQASSSDD